MMPADATDIFGGDWEQIELGPGAGAGRPARSSACIRQHVSATWIGSPGA